MKVLHVHGTGDAQSFGEARCGLKHAVLSFDISVDRRQNHRGVTTVHAGVLKMLRHSRDHDLAVVGNNVDVVLEGVLEVLADDNGVFARHVRGTAKVAIDILLVPDDAHCGARQNVRRAYQHWESHLGAEAEGVVHRAEGGPRRLVDTDRVTQPRELGAVLCDVDIVRAGAKNGRAGLLQRHCKVLGDLATEADDNALDALLVHDVEDALERDLVEVEAVAFIIVGRNSLRVVVQNGDALATGTEGAGSEHSAVVELHTAADAVHTTPQDQNDLLAEVNVVKLCVVRHIQIIALRRELTGDGVDLLHNRANAQLLTVLAHF
eukprot:PhM_4_TR10802/c0_g2_i1/m.9393